MTKEGLARAGAISKTVRTAKKKKQTEEEMELLTGMFLTPVVLTFTDGTQEETTPQDLTEEKLQHFLEEARSGKPYPAEVELGEIKTTGNVTVDDITISIDTVKEYSPLALALCKGWLDRLQGFIDGKKTD